MRNAGERREHDADGSPFLVGVDRVVLFADRPTERGYRERQVERDLRERRADPHAPDKRRPERPENPQARELDVTPERIGDEIDGMAQVEERADTVILAERRSPGLEERLRRNHQNAHLVRQGIVPSDTLATDPSA